MVFLQQFHVHAGVVIKPLQVTHGDQGAQVAVSLLVHDQEGEMVGIRSAARRGGSVPPVSGGYVHLAPKDRFDPCLHGLIVELDHPEHIAVVRNGHALHPQTPGLFKHPVDPDRPVKQAEFRMHMKVYKW